MWNMKCICNMHYEMYMQPVIWNVYVIFLKAFFEWATLPRIFFAWAERPWVMKSNMKSSLKTRFRCRKMEYFPWACVRSVCVVSLFDLECVSVWSWVCLCLIMSVSLFELDVCHCLILKCVTVWALRRRFLPSPNRDQVFPFYDTEIVCLTGVACHYSRPVRPPEKSLFQVPHCVAGGWAMAHDSWPMSYKRHPLKPATSGWLGDGDGLGDFLLLLRCTTLLLHYYYFTTTRTCTSGWSGEAFGDFLPVEKKKTPVITIEICL